MLNGFEALQNFFEELGMEAWMEGHLPDRAAFPYVLWEPALPPPFETGRLGAKVWFRGMEGQLQRWQCLQRWEKQLPAGGRKLPAGHGCLLLRRGNPWVRPISDRNLLGLALQIEIRNCGV